VGYWMEKGLNIVHVTISLTHAVSPFAPFVERRVETRPGGSGGDATAWTSVV